ncbi:hypothetical protein [Methanobacterium spitsbergense]|uniref:Uncharacterized protein n=1 Tax=Methanobacterium spitsbergense TaxID=2874285 RepID=A0A8T5UW55_9EURY|nr:hypothetical protein [Methanobacterium spitsbergense]MBZ2165410.1 hypothetical protein [Methanobacterium spitsbergense]
MVDEMFENIKKAFLDNFEDCSVFNATTDIQVEFKHKNDSDWFNENIVMHKGLEEDEYPISILSSVTPKNIPSGYIFKFKVLNTDKLIVMLNTH